MIADANSSIPTLLFGAFDRHNFGDLLFPHVVAALLPGKELHYAGLAERDLRCHGGHRVRALAQLAAEWQERSVNILHAGGELLTCDAWQAAVMLLPPEQARATIKRLDAQPKERLAWAQRQLGFPALAPYSVQRLLFPRAASVIYNAVGGVGLDACATALRDEVLANLKAADGVGVRDRETLALLEAAGIPARLMPDPAVMVAALFDDVILRHAQTGEVGRILAAFPQGYLAVQFSADFGDDATLQQIAAQLGRVALDTGLGLVFFRAGAAPWHDDLDCFQRAAAHLPAEAAIITSTLNLWDICALIAHSRGYIGSSLHGRIVAMAYALPRINFHHPAQNLLLTKQAAYAASWELAGLPGSVAVHEVAAGMRRAMAADAREMQQLAASLVSRYRQEFAALCVGLK